MAGIFGKTPVFMKSWLTWGKNHSRTLSARRSPGTMAYTLQKKLARLPAQQVFRTVFQGPAQCAPFAFSSSTTSTPCTSTVDCGKSASTPARPNGFVRCTSASSIALSDSDFSRHTLPCHRACPDVPTRFDRLVARFTGRFAGKFADKLVRIRPSPSRKPFQNHDFSTIKKITSSAFPAGPPAAQSCCIASLPGAGPPGNATA